MVDAPYRASAGTSIGPIESRSILTFPLVVASPSEEGPLVAGLVVAIATPSGRDKFSLS
jgi:hypothetical protein